MAKIQNVEKAQFIENTIGIYAKNKVGQYSRFLDKTPIFTTYYHIAKPLSRTDVGTGGFEDELGPRSPLRYNKILQFPMYNIPELKPDIVFDETGYDVELDLSDITVLPGTIRPVPGDYFMVSLPATKEFLFRVNDIRYNTIQSNDFYTLSCEIKDIGIDLETKREMKGQIVGEYQTVFDNIGTEDRCFVKTTDIDYLNSISDLYFKLREYYKNAFYNRDLNTFTINLGYDCSGSGCWINDPYLEKFINDAHLYYDAGESTSLLMSLNTFKPSNFDLNFSRSLYSALLKNSLELLSPYPYGYFMSDQDRFSTYAHYGYHGMVPYLVMRKSPMAGSIGNADPDKTTDDSGVITESTDVSSTIINHGDPNDEYYETNINGITVDNVNVLDNSATYEIPWYSIMNTPKWIPTWTCTAQYMSFSFIHQILNGEIETNDYCELIIFNYLHGIPMKYDRKLIIDELEESIHNFYYIPMVIFVLGQLYQQYFHKEKAFEL